ncbi:MAG: hypothetical protein ACD_58C00235G0001 [uncultured bacterium]|nr:MAG: hypothetical protein ACD_58C00235G0001 [uncultured bacterium]
MSVSRGGSIGNKSDGNQIIKKIYGPKGFNFLSCFSYQGFCFLIFLIIIGLVIYLLICFTKTGLVNIPILTKIFYHEPAPNEVVTPASGFTIENRINLKNIALGEITYILTQEELTTLVNTSDKLTRGQIAILDLNAELFAETKIINRPAFIVIKFVPTAKNDQLDFKIISAQIGDQQIPLFIANLSKSILLGSIKQQLKVLNDIKITNIDIKKGQLLLTTRPL